MTVPLPKQRGRIVLALLVGLVTLLPALAIASIEDKRSDAWIEETSGNGAAIATIEWRAYVDRAAEGLREFQSFWRNSDEVTEVEFRSYSTALFEGSPTVRSVVIIREDGIAEWVEPQRSLEGTNLSLNETWRRQLADIELESVPTRTSLIELTGGGQGYRFAAPLRDASGNTTRAIALEVDIVDSVQAVFGPLALRDFHLVYSEGGVERFRGGGAPGEGSAPAHVQLLSSPRSRPLDSEHPALTVYPNEDFHEELESEWPTYLRFAGVIAAVITSSFAWRELGRRREQIEGLRNLSASEAHYRDLFENAGELFLVLDGDLCIVEVNARAEDTLGYGATELAGRRFADLVIPADREMIDQRLARVGTAGGSRTVETTLVARDGQHVAVYGAATSAGGGSGLRTYLSDVSKLKELERDLRLANTALSEKVRDLDAFTHTVAHDLRNPLRGITTSAEFIEEDFGDVLPEEGRELVGRIRESSERMNAMVQAMLAYATAGGERYPPERVDLVLLLDEVFADLAPLISSAGADVAREGEFPVVEAQRIPLQQVFTNLVSNAIKHKENGPAHVRVTSHIDDAGDWVFSVEDDGPGIPPGTEGRLFDLFARGATNAPGSGVGLAIVKRVVEAHGGRVHAHNRPEGGAVFWFTIPRSRAIPGREPVGVQR